MSEPFYKDGLKFQCAQCGKCCTGDPGFVWLSTQEMVAMAEKLNITPIAFKKKYTRTVKGRISLIEKTNYDCIFYEKSVGCTLYEARPMQCRTYPFWPELLKSEDDYKWGTSECKGVGRGKLWTREEIEQEAAKHPKGVY